MQLFWDIEMTERWDCSQLPPYMTATLVLGPSIQSRGSG